MRHDDRLPLANITIARFSPSPALYMSPPPGYFWPPPKRARPITEQAYFPMLEGGAKIFDFYARGLERSDSPSARGAA